MNIRQVNATKYSDYLICPSLYYYKHLEDFSDILFGHNKDTKNGEMIHSIIDAHFKGIPLSSPYIESNLNIKQWFDYYLENYQPADNTDVYSEWSFNVPVSTPMEKVNLSGRIDRFICEKDKIIIIDWKSSAKTNKFADFINHRQMEFYAYALNKLKNIDKFEIKLVYLQLKKEIIINFSKNDLEAIEKNLFKMIKGTNPNIKNYIPEPLYIENIPACKGCHFFSLCENFL